MHLSLKVVFLFLEFSGYRCRISKNESRLSRISKNESRLSMMSKDVYRLSMMSKDVSRLNRIRMNLG